MTNVIEKNTEYSIKMPDGKVQKFAYYGEKTNGRLILMNTRFGTLTTMSAFYFAKLIKKYPTKTRPYNVEGIFADEPSAILPPEEKKVVVDPIEVIKAKEEVRLKFKEEKRKADEERKAEAERKAAAEIKAKEERRKAELDDERKKYLKWALRLKSLPMDVEIKLRDAVKVEPRILGENVEKWVSGEYKGSILELIEKFNEVKELLKGTEWYVK